MFNVQKIMQDAWDLYRAQTRRAFPTRARDRRRLFGQCLKNAWLWAKERAAKALMSAEELKAERIATLKKEISNLVYLPAHMNLARRAEALEAEVRQLQAA